MPTRYSIAQRTPLLNSLFAGIACAVALTLAVGPAMASTSDLERVEINGRVVDAPIRYDAHAGCKALDRQLQEALQTTWERERRTGQVKVRVVMDGGEVTDVQADGMSNTVRRAVRQAVSRLECGPQASAGTQVYRFDVDFIDPDHRRARAAGFTRYGYRLALLND